jgi:hypothetical protein
MLHRNAPWREMQRLHHHAYALRDQEKNRQPGKSPCRRAMML